MTLDPQGAWAGNCFFGTGRLRLVLLVSAILVALALTPSLGAQTTANVTGVVNDPTGARIPGATVQVEGKETGITRFLRERTE